jgi:hypothetical protein
MKKVHFLLFISVLSGLLAADEKIVNVLHSSWEGQLQQFVKENKVDYSAWKKEEKKLDTYLKDMAAVDHKKLEKDQRLAFYINLYNASTVKLILSHWNKKIKSIKDISNRWSIKVVGLKDGKISLEDLEHKFIRAVFKDSRIHFAINCASIGCPDLWDHAYSAENVDKELNAARERFLKNGLKGVKVKKEKGTFYGHNYYVYVSKIFDWFEKDFKRETKTVLAYIEKHGSKDQKAFIKKNRKNISIKYLDYDWKLNGK